jgi:hypothetical protein
MIGHAAGMYPTFSKLVAANIIKIKTAGASMRHVAGAAHEKLQNN